MNIVAGMLLMCAMKISSPEGFLRNVETKVWFVKPNGDAFVEYNLSKHEMFKDLTLNENYEIIHVDSLKSKNYGDCKEIK